MDNRKVNSILNNVLKKVSPLKEENAQIKVLLENFLNKIESRIGERKIKAEIFVGGSFAKDTMIKKDNYDIDLFLRFSEDGNLSNLTHDLLEGICDFEMVHGSRDYFKVKIKDYVYFEIVPVKKVNNPKDADNITDLSYSHVKYINKKVKDKKVLNEIRLAKAFCYAIRCYGAESYISGFSGYSLELLVYYYGSFVKFLKGMIKASKGKKKMIIDINLPLDSALGAVREYYPITSFSFFSKITSRFLFASSIIFCNSSLARNFSSSVSFPSFSFVCTSSHTRSRSRRTVILCSSNFSLNTFTKFFLVSVVS